MHMIYSMIILMYSHYAPDSLHHYMLLEGSKCSWQQVGTVLSLFFGDCESSSVLPLSRHCSIALNCVRVMRRAAKQERGPFSWHTPLLDRQIPRGILAKVVNGLISINYQSMPPSSSQLAQIKQSLAACLLRKSGW